MIRAGMRGAVGLALALGLPPVAMAAGTAAVVYRDPSCGCCHAWVSYLRDHGFQVSVRESEPMPAVKARLGAPVALASCHTARIGRYVIEGHVPVQDVRRLLAERPDAWGLAAPGMPIGSPGMEMGPAQPYDVRLIDSDGSSRVFAHHGSRG